MLSVSYNSTVVPGNARYDKNYYYITKMKINTVYYLVGTPLVSIPSQKYSQNTGRGIATP